MLCEKCNKNKAIIKYTQNINGNKVDYNLCSNCFNIINNNNFIYNFFSNNLLNNTYENKLRCSLCNTTFDKFKNTGKIGCSNCYDVFKPKLDYIFNDIQEKNIHIGKKPKNIDLYNQNQNNINLLRDKLNIAIKNEDYEEAIKLRDKIRELEGSAI